MKEVRGQFLLLLKDMEEVTKRLRALEPELHRRPYVRKASVQSEPMSPELKAAIRKTAKENPDMSMHDIGTRHGVNMGRVSEVLAGFRR